MGPNVADRLRDRLTRLATTARRRRGWTIAVGIALIGVSLALLPAPLRAATVAAYTLPAACIASSAWLLLSRRSDRSRRVLGLLLLPIAAALIAVIPFVIAALPYAASAGAALGAIVLLARAAASAVPVSVRIRRALLALASLAAAALAFSWPDLALLAVATAFTLALLTLGVTALITATTRTPRTPHPRLRSLAAWTATVLAVAVTAGAGTASAALSTGWPSVTGFYEWGAPLPHEPGRLLRAEPAPDSAPAHADAWRMLYTTTSPDGTVTTASAIVAVPRDQGSDRLVLAWQHGTTGVTRTCAPSLGHDALTDAAIPDIDEMIARGWVVVATDYPGQGTSGPYPYLVGEGEARATLDAVRATQQLTEARAGNQVMLWGHSQGGHATLWAGQIAPDYAPDLTIRGVAALSAAADPLAMAHAVLDENGSSPAAAIVTAYVLVPYSQQYPDIRLDQFMHPAGVTLATAAASRCTLMPATLVSVLAAAWAGADAPLYRLDLDNPSAATVRRLTENIADGIVPAPLFLGQGEADEVVPVAVQRNLAAQVCAAGRAVSVHEYPDRTHMGVLTPDSPLRNDLFTWTDAVLAGDNPTTC